MNTNYMESQFKSTVIASKEDENKEHNPQRSESKNSSLIDYARKKSPLASVFNNYELSDGCKKRDSGGGQIFNVSQGNDSSFERQVEKYSMSDSLASE